MLFQPKPSASSTSANTRTRTTALTNDVPTPLVAVACGRPPVVVAI